METIVRSWSSGYGFSPRLQRCTQLEAVLYRQMEGRKVFSGISLFDNDRIEFDKGEESASIGEVS